MVGPANAIDSAPTMIRIQVTKRPKLSAETTPKLETLWFQRSSVATAAPTRPTMPSTAVGMRSPGSRNDSATIAARPAAVTHNIGTIALSEEIMAPDARLKASRYRDCAARVHELVARAFQASARRLHDSVARAFQASARRLHHSVARAFQASARLARGTRRCAA